MKLKRFTATLLLTALLTAALFSGCGIFQNQKYEMPKPTGPITVSETGSHLGITIPYPLSAGEITQDAKMTLFEGDKADFKLSGEELPAGVTNLDELFAHYEEGEQSTAIDEHSITIDKLSGDGTYARYFLLGNRVTILSLTLKNGGDASYYSSLMTQFEFDFSSVEGMPQVTD